MAPTTRRTMRSEARPARPTRRSVTAPPHRLVPRWRRRRGRLQRRRHRREDRVIEPDVTRFGAHGRPGPTRSSSAARSGSWRPRRAVPCRSPQSRRTSCPLATRSSISSGCWCEDGNGVPRRPCRLRPPATVSARSSGVTNAVRRCGSGSPRCDERLRLSPRSLPAPLARAAWRGHCAPSRRRHRRCPTLASVARPRPWARTPAPPARRRRRGRCLLDVQPVVLAERLSRHGSNSFARCSSPKASSTAGRTVIGRSRPVTPAVRPLPSLVPSVAPIDRRHPGPPRRRPIFDEPCRGRGEVPRPSAAVPKALHQRRASLRRRRHLASRPPRARPRREDLVIRPLRGRWRRRPHPAATSSVLRVPTVVRVPVRSRSPNAPPGPRRPRRVRSRLRFRSRLALLTRCEPSACCGRVWSATPGPAQRSPEANSPGSAPASTWWPRPSRRCRRST